MPEVDTDIWGKRLTWSRRSNSWTLELIDAMESIIELDTRVKWVRVDDHYVGLVTAHWDRSAWDFKWIWQSMVCLHRWYFQWVIRWNDEQDLWHLIDRPESLVGGMLFDYRSPLASAYERYLRVIDEEWNNSLAHNTSTDHRRYFSWTHSLHCDRTDRRSSADLDRTSTCCRM